MRKAAKNHVNPHRRGLDQARENDGGVVRSEAMWRYLLALAVLCDLLPPPGLLAHQAGCHWLHSCPSDRGNYVCGDLGHCGECPDNQFCQAGQPRQAMTLPPAPAPREAPPMPAADAPTPKAPTIDAAITGKTVAIVDGDTLEVLYEGTPEIGRAHV